MIIRVLMSIDVKTTETHFTDQVRSEINQAIRDAFRPAYKKGSFVANFNSSNGARFINNYTIDSSEVKEQ